MLSPNRSAVAQELGVQLHRMGAQLWLAWSVVALLSSSILMFMALNWLGGSKLMMAVALLSSLTLGVSLFFIRHMLRLLREPGPILILGPGGLLDRASLFGLGKVPRQDLVFFKIQLRWGFLSVHMRLNSRTKIFKSMSPLKKFVLQNYILWWGPQFWLPLAWLDIEAEKLKAYWSELQSSGQGAQPVSPASPALGLELVKEPASASNKPHIPPPPPRGRDSEAEIDLPPVKSATEVLKTQVASPPPPPSVREDSVFIKISKALGFGKSKEERSEQKTESQAPPSSEKSFVLQKISALREYVQAAGLDRFLCDLYREELSWLPTRAPSVLGAGEGGQVLGVHWLTRQADYEELGFDWMDKSFQFGLKKDLKGGEQGLLRVVYQGQEVFVLKVLVEIGSFEPLEVEKFIDGAWEEELRTLGAHLRALSQPALEEEATEVSSVEELQEETDLSDLKKRFGLGE